MKRFTINQKVKFILNMTIFAQHTQPLSHWDLGRPVPPCLYCQREATCPKWGQCPPLTKGQGGSVHTGQKLGQVYMFHLPPVSELHTGLLIVSNHSASATCSGVHLKFTSSFRVMYRLVNVSNHCASATCSGVCLSNGHIFLRLKSSVSTSVYISDSCNDITRYI